MDIDLWQGAFTGTPDKCRDRPEAGRTAIPDVLPAQSFRELLAGIEGLSGTERSFLPTHKKGGTVAFDTLKAEAPALVASYLFDGARVLHKVTPIAEGERRTVLSMTYCTDPRNSRLQGIARRIKDMAFFGPRALWT